MNKVVDLKNIATCSYCNSIFESPIILPCSETICEKHLNDFKNPIDPLKTIQCYFCYEDHLIPKNGFPMDKRMTKLIEYEFHQIDFGETHKKAVCLCHDLNKMIEKIGIITKDPDYFITEYFDKITNEIDLRREESKLVIEKWHESRLLEINKYKTECLNKLAKKLKPDNSIIDKTKKDLELWQKKLSVPELSNAEYSFKNIEKNITGSLKALSENFELLREEFLLGNEFKFLAKPISEHDFGEIYVEKKRFF